jgi:hypothetical protein
VDGHQDFRPGRSACGHEAWCEGDSDDFSGVIMKPKDKLWKLCEKFVKDNTISCPETIHQCDWVSENSPELVQAICEIVGYHKYEEEDGDESDHEMEC